MARPPQQRPALARNFKVDLGRATDTGTIAQVVLPRFTAAETDAETLLTIRRAATADRLFHDWWDEARNGRPKPRPVTVTMLDTDMKPILAWRFSEARPWALSYGLLDATVDGLLTETLELVFERMERV